MIDNMVNCRHIFQFVLCLFSFFLKKTKTNSKVVLTSKLATLAALTDMEANNDPINLLDFFWVTTRITN